MTTPSDTLEKCAQLVVNARRIVCFTGAGMSAESGIETFRGGNGLWNGALGTIVLGWFGTPIGWKWTPSFAWSQYIRRFYNPIRDAQPNAGHRALVQLQDMHPNLCIITQNVDGLHQKAGSDPNRVFEVHGTVRRSRCIANGHIYDFEDHTILPDKSPTCRVEGCRSSLRPDCVLFTESLPTDQWMRAEFTTRQLEGNDVMIIVGTSATVYPAASLPELAVQRGATLIDVNLVRMKSSDLRNYEYLGGTAATTLPALVNRIFAVQHVDVCMFSNGKFKNVVADINENHEIRPGELHRKVYSLLPIKGPTKNWIAVEGSPSHSGTTDSIPLANYSYKISSSAPRGPQSTDERNVFAIYVSYYIKVKLALSGMGGEVTLKLPFILGHIDDSLEDKQDHHDDVEKKLDTQQINESDATAAAIAAVGDEVNAKAKIDVESTSGTIGDENSFAKNCNDMETGANNGIKTIEKCRNANGLSIDVIVEDMSDGKCGLNIGQALETGTPTRTRSSDGSSNCNETERNINVVTAQIHSSAV